MQKKYCLTEGKCGVAGCFDIIYNYTVEMYPTVVRTTGLGICSMVGRFGGIAAPMVREVLSNY